MKSFESILTEEPNAQNYPENAEEIITRIKKFTEEKVSISRLEEFLQHHDINKKYQLGRTLLQWFACCGDFDAVKYLSGKGADANTLDIYGDNIINMIATFSNNNFHIIQLLSINNANMNLFTPEIPTPLANVIQRIDNNECFDEELFKECFTALFLVACGADWKANIIGNEGSKLMEDIINGQIMLDSKPLDALDDDLRNLIFSTFPNLSFHLSLQCSAR